MTQAQRKILVIGSGGREHALAWKLAASAGVGAYIGGQITNMAYPSADLSDPRWVKCTVDGMSVWASSSR